MAAAGAVAAARNDAAADAMAAPFEALWDQVSASAPVVRFWAAARNWGIQGPQGVISWCQEAELLNLSEGSSV